MLKSTLLILATSYFAWYLERFETTVIYPFDATHTSPATAGEPRLIETRFATGDGEMLVIWRVDARPGRPTLLYLPGNAGALKDRAERFSGLIDRGYGVTALAYRGSSGSTGTPDETLMTDDAQSVARSLNARPLILYGESLGTAVAIKLAGAGLGDAVILEAPFTSIVQLFENRYPHETLDDLITQKWDSLTGMPDVLQPLLILHGSDDKVVPIRMGRTLYAEAGSVEKSFVEIEGAGHAEEWTPQAQAALFDFLDRR